MNSSSTKSQVVEKRLFALHQDLLDSGTQINMIFPIFRSGDSIVEKQNVSVILYLHSIKGMGEARECQVTHIVHMEVNGDAKLVEPLASHADDIARASKSSQRSGHPGDPTAENCEGREWKHQKLVRSIRSINAHQMKRPNHVNQFTSDQYVQTKHSASDENFQLSEFVR
jgi:hypothetical protein